MKVFLIGFMGSGKTTFGKKLANALNYDFIDLDKRIEEEEKMDINAIFKRFGENYFRKKESEVLKNLEKKHFTIVSTGGGTPCFFDNMNWIKSNGKSIYLKASPGFLFSRIKDSPNIRPLFSGMEEIEIQAAILDLLTKREVFYEQADHIVDCKTLAISEVVNKLGLNVEN